MAGEGKQVRGWRKSPGPLPPLRHCTRARPSPPPPPSPHPPPSPPPDPPTRSPVISNNSRTGREKKTGYAGL